MRLAALIALTITTLLTFSLTSQPAFSAQAATTIYNGAPQIALKPGEYNPLDMASRSYFILTVHANEHLQSQVRIINTGNAPGKVQLYAVDATTGQTGGAVYQGEDVARQDVGAWLSLGQTPFVLSAGQSLVVPFQLTIPRNVRAGQHFGGIVAKLLPLAPVSTTASPESKMNIDLHVRTIVAVQVTAEGPQVENLQASAIQASTANSYQEIQVSLHNTGNMLLKPAGSLQITNEQGQQVQNVALNLDTFLPQTAIDYPVYLPYQALPAATYQATLILRYGHQHVLHYQTSFTISAEMVQHVLAANHLQAPPPVNTGGTGLPLWSEVALGMFALLGIFFAIQQVRRFWHR